MMTLDGKIICGLFKHERLKLVIIRTSQGNVYNMPQLRQIVTLGMMVNKLYKRSLKF